MRSWWSFTGLTPTFPPPGTVKLDTVPTWNYAVVHVYGAFEALHDREDTVDVVQQVVDYYESFLPQPWKTDFDSPYNRKMIKGVTAFRIRIDRVVGKWKLGQNRPEYIRRRAIDASKNFPRRL